MNKKIVAIGGGHGLGRILSALQEYGQNVTGIVTTTDNGGSTGKIRQYRGGIAWGDTRNCINQLISEPSVSSMIFEYRFKESGELEGHNLGNLMLSALDDLTVRPLTAIDLIRDLLKIHVNIIPMSEDPTDLVAMTASGKKINGEIHVDTADEPLARLKVDPIVAAPKEAITSLREADIIILGPGSFLTSIMPPLLLPDISHAIANNNRAVLILVDNLAAEHGPASQMSFTDKLSWCEEACGGRKIDIVLGEAPQQTEPGYLFIQKQLSSSEHNTLHDKNKLKAALDEIINNPSDYKHAS